MSDFLFVSGWSSYRHGNSSKDSLNPHSHTCPTIARSQTPTPATPSRSRFALPHRLMQSKSSPNISNAAARMAVASPQPVTSPLQHDPQAVMDTRTPSPDRRHDTASSPQYSPDLSAEVAMLSTKLVNAINFQTNLDDSLQQSRHELEQQRQRCAELELEKARHDELVSSGVLVKKADTDKVIAKLRSELAGEKAARDAAERARKQTEAEVENLTGALFEEANNMVANARKETEALERRNIQLKSQLHDQETVMASQQEQLQDLKATIEKIQAQTPPLHPSVPSTPVTANAAVFEALQTATLSPSLADLPPEHPLHFSALISPVLRSDITAFSDFQDLLMLARRLGAHSRQNSNNGSQQAGSQGTYTSSSGASSSPSLPGSFSFTGNSSPVTGASMANLPALKDSKFYKRALTEDIEPTLRLDLAPGLSFLSRRTVLSSLLQGSLSIEPYPQNKHYFSCTMCGESRKGEQFVRKYRFRTSEDDAVSKPLCDYCLARIRSTCDFVGFLRMVRDGHWRCDSEDDQKSAWEESVRLRERMFWSRLGGGVVPCVQSMPRATEVPPTPSSVIGSKSARPSLESIPEKQHALADASPVEQDPDVFQGASDRPRSAVGQAIINASSGVTATAMPDLQPSARSSKRENPFVTPPPSSHAQLDESDAAEPAAAEPTTPFESANQQSEQDLTVATALPAESTDPEGQQPAEIPSEEYQAQPAEAPAPSPRTSLPVPAPLSRETSPTRPTIQTKLTTPSSSQRSSLSVDRPAEQHARKNSSVLARVRAMEASSTKTLPGAFE